MYKHVRARIPTASGSHSNVFLKRALLQHTPARNLTTTTTRLSLTRSTPAFTHATPLPYPSLLRAQFRTSFHFQHTSLFSTSSASLDATPKSHSSGGGIEVSEEILE